MSDADIEFDGVRARRRASDSGGRRTTVAAPPHRPSAGPSAARKSLHGPASRKTTHDTATAQAVDHHAPRLGRGEAVLQRTSSHPIVDGPFSRIQPSDTTMTVKSTWTAGLVYRVRLRHDLDRGPHILPRLDRRRGTENPSPANPTGDGRSAVHPSRHLHLHGRPPPISTATTAEQRIWIAPPLLSYVRWRPRRRDSRAAIAVDSGRDDGLWREGAV
jgi:hypothetical protein